MKIISTAQGIFYPNKKTKLVKIFQSYETTTQTSDSRMVIVPHAGYEFSGQIAFKTYNFLNKDVRNITIIAPAIYTKLYGYITSNQSDTASTPIGDISLEAYDTNINSEIIKKETSIGVQFPMIKYLFPQATVTPIVYGCIDYKNLNEIIETQFNKNSAIIIVTNLSRFIPAKESNKLDNHLIRKIKNYDITDFDNELADGAAGVCAAIEFAREHNFEFILTAHSNSGEINGDTSKVVGYGGWYLSTR